MRDPRQEGRYLTSKEMRAYRKELFDKQCGACHWCQGTMMFMEACPPGQNVGKVATFEHLQDRLSSGGRQGSLDTIVLACSDCNNQRNREREALVMNALREHFGEEHHHVRRGKTMQELIQVLDDLGINPLT